MGAGSWYLLSGATGRRRGHPATPGIIIGARRKRQADVAQLVEHHLAKVRVAGSNPVVRSEVPEAVSRADGQHGSAILGPNPSGTDLWRNGRVA